MANNRKSSNDETIKAQSEAASADINTTIAFPQTMVNIKDGHCSIPGLIWMKLGIL